MKKMKEWFQNQSKAWKAALSLVIVNAFAKNGYYAWNPKDLFAGIIDTISYLLAIVWVVVLANYGIKRKFLAFTMVFFFGGIALSLLNSTTREIALTYMGRALQAILDA